MTKADLYLERARKFSQRLANYVMSNSETRLVLVILCQTLYQKKDEAAISLRDFSNQSNVQSSKVCRCLKKLILNKIIVKKEINKCNFYSLFEWLPTLQKETSVPSKQTVSKQTVVPPNQTLPKRTVGTVQLDASIQGASIQLSPLEPPLKTKKERDKNQSGFNQVLDKEQKINNVYSDGTTVQTDGVQTDGDITQLGTAKEGYKNPKKTQEKNPLASDVAKMMDSMFFTANKKNGEQNFDYREKEIRREIASRLTLLDPNRKIYTLDHPEVTAERHQIFAIVENEKLEEDRGIKKTDKPIRNVSAVVLKRVREAFKIAQRQTKNN